MTQGNSAKRLTIGKVAKRAGVGVETVRFYERQGLIADPPRTKSGYRQYPEETIDQLNFIKQSRALGFSLTETRDLLHLHTNSHLTPEQVRENAAKKIEIITDKIESLQRIRNALEQLRAAPGKRDNYPTIMDLLHQA